MLDVGGGEGLLAQFLDEAKFEYCLAEPTVNGISGIALPFAPKSFDIVVSCHVLEHIPIDDRVVFLDNLVNQARKAVVFLNPFEVPKTHVTERLKLLISITGADWAKEHLDAVCQRSRTSRLTPRIGDCVVPSSPMEP